MTSFLLAVAGAVIVAVLAWLFLDAVERFCPSDHELDRRARELEREGRRELPRLPERPTAPDPELVNNTEPGRRPGEGLLP